MAYIQVNGFPHYYEWIDRPSTAGNKPVMVFIHGWGGSDRYWESTAQALADSFDCLLYDLRGFGRSIDRQGIDPRPELLENTDISAAELSYELEAYADDLNGLLEALQIERVYLNAHSMGASIATYFLNLYPQRVEKAILTCSGIFEYDEAAFNAFYKFGGYVVKFRPRWLSKIPFADRIFMARFLYRSLPSSVSTAFLEDFLLADYTAALQTIFASVSKKATEVMPQEFSKLSIPTLLVAGERDKIIPAAMGRQAANLNPLVQFAEIPQTAHFPMLEDAGTYLQIVREFLQVKAAA